VADDIATLILVIVSFYIPVYLYKSMRHIYGQEHLHYHSEVPAAVRRIFDSCNFHNVRRVPRRLAIGLTKGKDHDPSHNRIQ